MSEKSKNREKELENFLRYSQDQMSEEERNAFERSLQQDPFAAEALEGLSSITPEEARAGLAQLQDKLHKRTTRPVKSTSSTRTMWLRMAAAVAVLLVVTSVLFTLFNERMGKLDRKVAESPGKEIQEPAPASPLEQTGAKTADEITAVQSKVEEEGIEATEKKKAAPDTSVERPTEAEPALKQVRKPVAEIIDEQIDAEELTREEEADIRTEKAAEEEIQTGELAAPPQAMYRQADVKSRKRAMAEQIQLTGAARGEQRTISGVVISGEDEQPLPGVVIAGKGSTTGTVTDLKGKFKISIEDDSMNTLIAQFIGMEPKEIPFLDQEELMITLEPDEKKHEDMVVIGMGPSIIAQPAGYAVNLAEYDEAQGKSAYPGALPVGGKEEFNEYVKSNIRFPENEETLSRAAVVLSFVVGGDGRPADVFVLKSPGKAFSDEAIRLLMEGPDWQPAAAGSPTGQATRVRILFK